MKNKIISLGIAVVVLSLAVFASSIQLQNGEDFLVLGATIATIAIFLRILPRHLASIHPNKKSYYIETNKTTIEDELMSFEVNLHSSGGLRPNLAEREVIIHPSGSNPLNWYNTPAHISTEESVSYKFSNTEHGESDIELGEKYGKFNAQLEDVPAQMEVYDCYTKKSVDKLTLKK